MKCASKEILILEHVEFNIPYIDIIYFDLNVKISN